MDNPVSSDAVLQQTGHDDDVRVVPQGTHGGETFSMDRVATTEVVERLARSGNGVMAVSERRERQAVSTRITAGPDFKGIIVQDSSDVNLSLGGQNAGIMKSDLLEINIKRVKDVFVKTAIYKRVKEQLEKYGHVTISGASGEGKTSTALMIGADLRKQGYELVFVDDVDTFKLDNCELRGKKVCLILDDIFGTVGLSTDVPHLRSILQNLKLYLEDIQYNKADQQETVIRVIFTTKSYNLECGIAKLEGQEFYFFSGPSLLDLTKMKSCHYSHEERKRILLKHQQYHNIKLELDLNTICDTTESVFGFPLTCKLFCEFLSFQKEPVQFFREPLFYLRRELDMIMERRNDQSAALILMLLCEDNLNLSQVEMESENNILEANLQAVKSVVTITSRTGVAKAARCYRGTFLTAGDILGFSHPTIYDACACALFNMNPSFVLKHCSVRFLYERVQAMHVESTAINDHLHIIYVSDVYNDAIASRLAEAIDKGNYSMSITHPILKNEQIVDKVFQELKLRKSNPWKRLLNTKHNKRLQMLHAMEDEKHLLYWAVHAHSLYLVEKIIEVGCKFSDEEIIEAFEACASCGNESVLLFLSSKYRTLFHQNVLNKALVIATEHNYKGVVSALLELGADVFKSTNHVEENVFQIAMRKGYRLLGREVFGTLTKVLRITEQSGDFDFQRAADAALRQAFTAGDKRLVKFFLLVSDMNARDSTGGTLIMDASLKGNIVAFNLLMSHGPDLTLTDDDNNNVLHLACHGGNRFIVERLLPFFDINCRGQDGLTGVMIAALCGKKDTFEMLVSKGADLTLTDDYNNNVLHLACEDGNRFIVERLLPLFDINCRGQNRWTGVMRAALFGKKDTFEMLVYKGADLTLSDDYNNNVLHAACWGGNRFIVERLLPFFCINCRGQRGLIGVMMAALSGKEDTFEMLVSKGADLTLTNDYNNNVLHLACEGGNRFIVERLLPLFDINCRGQNRWTGVMRAALFGKKDTFEMLVSKGADLTLTDDHNNNVLHVACWGGNRFIVERLLPLFDINCRGQRGLIGVMMAALSGKEDTFEMLVSKGADLTLTDDDNNNVLHLACQGGNRLIVESLLPLFDINCRGGEGLTGVMRAALFGKKDTFEMLVSKGADLTLTDDYNNNVLHLACQGGNRLIVECLLPLFDINCRGEYGWTPFMMAALSGKNDVWLLLRSGGNRLLVGDNNHTVLHTASRGGNMTIVKDVIDLFDINTRGLHGRTPLLEAARGGHIAVVDFLVSRNADVKMVDNWGNSLLHAACFGGHLGMVKHVCPWFNIDDRDLHGWTPAMVAAVFGKQSVFDYLKRQGADLTLVDKTGDGVFTLALQGGCRQIIEQLSPDGQHVKKPTPWNELMRSIVTGWMYRPKIYGENSPDPVVQTDQFGDSLLHLACRGGNRRCVDYLLPSYDIDVGGRYDWTPVMMAALCGHDDVFKLLMSHNPDLSLVSDTGEAMSLSNT